VKPGFITLHSRAARLTHWTWALGIFILIGSGWRIYDQEPIFRFLYFPIWMTIGGTIEGAQRVHNEIGLAGALLWHLFAMWLLFFSLIAFLIYGFVSGHFRRKYLPIWPAEVLANIRDFLTGHLAHPLGVRNAVQKLLYVFAIVSMILMVWSGLVLWKPHNFSELGIPLGGYEGAHYVHFFGMAGIVGFIVVHVVLTILVPKTLPPMITGTAPASSVSAQSAGEAR
jgi:thiosulfate reductase cytochrome b subunit